MTLVEAISFFAIMIVLAAMPSASVALVVIRSACLGVGNGMAVAAGIVLGDVMFVLLAILGLALLAETLGAFFAVIKYAGAGYLIWTGIILLKSGPARLRLDDASYSRSVLTSFIAGFTLTLGDIKAILFYASLFPMFFDVDTLRQGDVLALLMMTILSVGGVKVVYALLAAKIASRAQGLKYGGLIKKTAGGLMIGAGGFIMAKA